MVTHSEAADDARVRIAIYELLTETASCSLDPGDGGLPCPEEEQVCAVGGMGPRCTYDASNPCDVSDGEFVRCRDGEIRLCSRGFEITARTCGIEETCTVGAVGPTCAVNPDAPCPYIDRRNQGCNGNAVRHCVEGFYEEAACASGLTCQVNDDGSAGFCGALIPSCSAARCAGDVPVSCVDGVELPALPCTTPTVCTVNGLDAGCASP